jgi:flagellar biogenesis protein FliO
MNATSGVLLALLLLAATVVVAMGIERWIHPRSRRTASTAGLRLLNQLRVGPGQRLLLLDCDGRRYLLSQGGQGVRLIDRLPDAVPDAAAVIATHRGVMS